ncbi:MAG: SRPBCC family protein [Halobacteria archaeon]|nr:SRPBCC family protein [Halobacteria archaeon]
MHEGRTREADLLMHVEVTQKVEYPAEDVWRLLVDTSTWADWGPSVKEVESSERRIREGTEGRVRVPGGVWVPFEITQLDEGDTEAFWKWDVGRIPATGHRVERLTGGSCRLTFEVPVYAAGYAPVCRRAIGKIEGILSEGR